MLILGIVIVLLIFGFYLCLVTPTPHDKKIEDMEQEEYILHYNRKA